MALLLINSNLNGSSKAAPKVLTGKTSYRLQKGHRVEIVDSATGKVPADLVGSREGADLLLHSRAEGVVLRIEGFFDAQDGLLQDAGVVSLPGGAVPELVQGSDFSDIASGFAYYDDSLSVSSSSPSAMQDFSAWPPSAGAASAAATGSTAAGSAAATSSMSTLYWALGGLAAAGGVAAASGLSGSGKTTTASQSSIELAIVYKPLNVVLENDFGLSSGDKITNQAHSRVNVTSESLDVGVDATGQPTTWQYRIDGGAWKDVVRIDVNHGYFDLEVGQHDYDVRQVDKATNASPISSLLNVIRDDVVVAPTLGFTNTADVHDNITSNAAVVVAGLEQGAKWQYSVDVGAVDGGAVVESDAVAGFGAFTLKEGSHTYTVSQTDLAGNVSVASTLVVTLDTQISEPIVVLDKDSAPNSKTNTDFITRFDQVNVSGIEANATWQYRVDGGDWKLPVDASSFKLDVGAHSYEVRQIDKAGNVSTIRSLWNVTLDTAANVPNLVLLTDSGSSNTDNNTSYPTVVVEGLEEGAIWEYQAASVGNVPIDSAWNLGSGYSFQLIDGLHDYYVRQTDLAGNTSGNAKLTATLDTKAPIPPGLALGAGIADGATAAEAKASTGVVTFTAESDASVVVELSDGVHTITKTAVNGAGTTPVAVTLNDDELSQLNDGLITVTAIATDTAGNNSGSNIGFILDRATPAALTFKWTDTGLADKPNTLTDKITSNSTVVVVGLEDGATWEYQVVSVGAAPNDGAWQPGVGNTFQLAEGSHDYYARQTDAAGNLGPNASLTKVNLDTKISAPIVTLAEDTGITGKTDTFADKITNNNLVNVSSLEEGATWQYRVDGGDWKPKPAVDAIGDKGSFSLDVGTHSYEVRQTDVAGNVSANISLGNVTLDIKADDPTLTLLSDTGLAGKPETFTDKITSNSTVVVTGLENGATWEYQVVSVGATPNASAWQSGTGVTFQLTAGQHDYYVRQTDVAGNVSVGTTKWTATLDAAAPFAPVIVLATDTGSSTSDRITKSVTVDVYAESGATVVVTFSHGSATVAKTVIGAGPATAVSISLSNTELANLGDGTINVLATATDGAGNNASSIISFVLDTTPPSAPTVELAFDTGSDAKDKLTNNATVNITAENGASVEVIFTRTGGGTVTKTVIGAGLTPVAVILSGTDVAALGDGLISVVARATDIASNVGLQSTPIAFTLDTNPPAAPVPTLQQDTGVPGDFITSNAIVNVAGIEAAATWQYRVDNGTWKTGTGTTFNLDVGQHSYEVRQTDKAGNTSVSGVLNAKLITVPLAPSMKLAEDTGISPVDNITNKATVNILGLEPSATWEYRIGDAGEWNIGVGTSFRLTEGTNNYYVRQTSVAGTIGPESAAVSFTLDTISPTAPVVLLGVGVVDGATAAEATAATGVVKVSAELGSSVEVTFTNGLKSVTKTVPGIGVGTEVPVVLTGADLNTLGDGTINVSAIATDKAGNSSAKGTASFVLDTVALPPTMTLADDTGSSITDSVTKNPTVNITGLEGGATWEYRVDANSWSLGNASTFTLTEGTHTYYVRQIDKAGNIGQVSAPKVFTLDTTPPTAPNFVLAEDTGISGDNITSKPTVNVSGLEPSATWQYRVDGGGWLNGSGSTFSLTTGSHTYEVRQIDLAGNEGSALPAKSFTYSTAAPNAPTIVLVTDTGTSSTDRLTNSVTMNVTADGGDSVDVVFSNGLKTLTKTLTGNGSTPVSVALTATELAVLTDGVITVVAIAKNTVGNTASSTTSFVLDTVAFAPTLVLAADTGINGDGITSNPTVNVTSLESGASWQYKIDSNDWQTGTGTSFQLIAGQHNYYVWQTDLAGNISNPSLPFIFDFDNTPPAMPGLALARDTGTSGTDKITKDGSVNVTAEVGTSVVVTFSNAGNSVSRTVFGTGVPVEVTLTSADLVTLGNGLITVTATASDKANNNSAVATYTYTLDTQVATPSPTLAVDTGINGDNITSNPTVNVTGLEPGASWQYQTDGGVWVNGIGTTFALMSGLHTYAVRQTDVAGNVSASGVLTAKYDNSVVPPSLVLGLGVADGATSAEATASTGVVLATAESGSTVIVTFTRGAQSVTKTVAGTGSPVPVILTSADLTALGDGLISVSAKAIDLANNSSVDSLPITFNLDTVAPDAPGVVLVADTGVSATDNITSNPTVNVSGIETNATWEYQVDGRVWQTGTATTFQLTEGAHVYNVRQTDVAGNVSINKTLNATYDPIAVTPALVLALDTGSSNSDNITNAATVNVLGLETGASWQYQVDGGDWVNGSGSTFQLTAGPHTYAARQTDKSGNLSLSGTLTATLDTTPPSALNVSLAADTGVSATDNITSNPTVNVSGIETNATWEYQVDGRVWQTGTATTFQLTEGAHVYNVRQTDVAGNVSINKTLNATYDPIAVTPALVLALDTGSSNSDNITNAATVNVLGLETGASWQYQVDGGDWVNGSGSTFQLTAGPHTYAARQTDKSGNLSLSGTLTATLDTTPPSAPVVSLAFDTGSSTTDKITNTATVNVTTEIGATVLVTFSNGTNVVPKTVTANGTTVSVGLSSDDLRQLGDGTISVVATATDVAGNTGPQSTPATTFTLDTTAPIAPVVVLAADTGSSATDNITSNPTVNVSGIETNATWQYQVDGGSWQTGVGTTFQLTQGVNVYNVRQTDLAGNVSLNKTLNATLDTVAVTPSLVLASDTGSSATDKITKESLVLVSGLEVGATWQYRIDGGPWLNGAGSSFTLTDGNHSYEARQTDAAGNTSLISSPISFTLDTTPPSVPIMVLGAGVSDGATAAEATAPTGAVRVTAEAGSSVFVAFTNGLNVVTKTIIGTGSEVPVILTGDDLITLRDGNITVTAIATDIAGNNSAISTTGFVLDTIAVTPVLALASDTGSSNTDNITNVATVNVLNLEVGATWQYRIDGGAWRDQSGNTFLLSTGTHTYDVHQTDRVLNTSLNGTLTATLDTAPPAAPLVSLAVDTGSSATDKITNDATVNVTAEAGASVTVIFTNPNNTNPNNSVTKIVIATGLPVTVVLSATEMAQLGDGSINVVAKAADIAGNVGPVSSPAVTFTLDRTPLALPVMTLAVDTGSSAIDNITSNAAVNVSLIQSVGGIWEYRVDGLAWQSGTVAVGGLSSFLLIEGTHFYEARQTDVAGNISIGTLIATLDTVAVPPTMALAIDAGFFGNDNITNVDTVIVSGIETNATWQYRVDGGLWKDGFGSSFALTAGTHNYEVRQKDAAGNQSVPSSVASFTLDTIAPSPPEITLFVGSDGIATETEATAISGVVAVKADSDTIVLVTFENVAGSPVNIEVTGTGLPVPVILSSDQLQQLTDGLITVKAIAMDRAGNISNPSMKSFVLDTFAPPPMLVLASDTGISPVDNITKVAGVNVLDLESGATWQYRVDTGPWQTGVGNSFQLVAGQHTYYAYQTDVLGHVSTYGSLTATLDTTSPASPVVVLGLDAADGATLEEATALTGLVTVTAESDVNVYVTFTRGTASLTKMVTGAGSSSVPVVLFSDEVAALGQGQVSVTATAIDLAGNSSGPSSPISFNLDTLAPIAPVIALGTGVANGATEPEAMQSSGVVTVVAESGALVEVFFWDEFTVVTEYVTGNGLVPVPVPVALSSANLALLTDGIIAVSARATDPASNQSAFSLVNSFILDRVPPVAPSLALAYDTGFSLDNLTSNPTINVVDLEAGATWQYRVDGGNWIAGSGSSFSATSGLHAYQVRQSDQAGNFSIESISLSVYFDPVAPLFPTLVLADDSGLSNGDNITNLATVNVSGIESGASWQYRVDGGNWLQGLGSSFDLAPGQHTYAVRQTDLAGNISISGSLTATLDTTPPAAPLLSAGTTAVNVSGLESGSAWVYRIDGGDWQLGEGASFALLVGQHNYYALQIDLAGNVSSESLLTTTLNAFYGTSANDIEDLTQYAYGASTALTINTGAGVDHVTATALADTFIVKTGDALANGVSTGDFETIGQTTPLGSVANPTAAKFNSTLDTIDLQGTLSLRGVTNAGIYSIDANGKVTWSSAPANLNEIVTAVFSSLLTAGSGQVAFFEFNDGVHGNGTFVLQENGTSNQDTLIFLAGVTGIVDFSTALGDANTLHIG